jgi:hypothetical protein
MQITWSTTIMMDGVAIINKLVDKIRIPFTILPVVNKDVAQGLFFLIL